LDKGTRRGRRGRREEGGGRREEEGREGMRKINPNNNFRNFPSLQPLPAEEQAQPPLEEETDEKEFPKWGYAEEGGGAEEGRRGERRGEERRGETRERRAKER
jgi:hypothetical protein